MKLTRHRPPGINLVRAHAPGEVRIGEHTYRSSLIVTAEQLITDWAPECVSDLEPRHLEPIFALSPDILLLGSGAQQEFPDPTLVGLILERGIGLEVMDTGAACRTFDVLVSEDRRVAAALFVRS
jgi:uncharacterized protein